MGCNCAGHTGGDDVTEAQKEPSDVAKSSTAPPPVTMTMPFFLDPEPEAVVVDGMVPSHKSQASLEPRPLTKDERDRAWKAANFRDATSGNASPIAIWILGPSSVGKSTLTAEVGPSFGIPFLPGAKGRRKSKAPTERSGPFSSPDDMRCRMDAVIIDGEYFRDAHEVWQLWVKTPDWRSAYPALKATINSEKDYMEAQAIVGKKHLIIPQTTLNLQKCILNVEKLVGAGYTNHVLAIVAPLDECQRRGRARELETGKRYQPFEFEQSVGAIPKMISACNGRYQVIRAVEENAGPLQILGYESLAEGFAGNSSTPSLPNAPEDGECCFNPQDLAALIANSISKKTSAD